MNVEDIGPTFGADVRRQAITGLVVVLAAISLYIALRFEPKMALGAMIALVHDVVITAGIYALVGREVTPETVIAILTILGFSLYDTVVIYDKIKENTESSVLVTRMGYAGVVDLSLNQVLMRSVNTSLVVLLPILSLLLFGGDTLKDFAFAMFIGVAIGAYSSIFLAAPLLAVLKMREKRYQQLEARRVARNRGGAGVESDETAPPSPTRCPHVRCRGPLGDRAHGVAATSEEQASPARQAQTSIGRVEPERTGMDIEQIKALIRDVPDFPEPGIVFKDITPVLADPIAFSTITDLIVVRFGRGNVDKVVGIEARGFIIASPVAYHFGAGFVPIRKQGKLPSETVAEDYELEYGTATLELHIDGITPGERVLIVDDVLATGGTAQAAASLVQRVGGKVCGIATVIELEFLHGRERLAEHELYTLIRY